VIIKIDAPMAAMSARLEKIRQNSILYPELSLRLPLYRQLGFHIWLHAGQAHMPHLYG